MTGEGLPRSVERWERPAWRMVRDEFRSTHEHGGRQCVQKAPGRPTVEEQRARVTPGLVAGDPGEYVCLHCGRSYPVRSTRDRHQRRCAKQPQPEGGENAEL